MKQNDGIRIGSFVLLLVLLLSIAPACKTTEPIKDNKDTTIVAVDSLLLDSKGLVKDLLRADCTKTLDEKEAVLTLVKARKHSDAELNTLIAQVEEQIRLERERIAKEEAEEALVQTTEVKLTTLFDGIAAAESVESANTQIALAMGFFSSENANVLIIIEESDGIKDYEKPTKIGNYLNYLKDQKKNPNTINRIIYDDNQKIKTLELRKK